MGVSVDAISDPIAPDQRALLAKIAEVKLPAQAITGEGTQFAISHKPNAAFKLVNAVLAQGGTVALAPDAVKTPEGTERGAFVIGGIGRAELSTLAGKFSVGAVAMGEPAHTVPLKAARVGLYRPWSPSIDEGWTRWILENFDFKPRSLYNADIRSANLRSRYDVIILPDMSSRQLTDGFRPGTVPGQYAGGIERSGLANLQEFVQAGGTLIAFNQAASAIIPLMSLPVKNVLQDLPNDKFFCAGSLLRIEKSHGELPVNFGVPDTPVVMFERGPAFETLPGFKGAILARYPREEDPLESGMVVHSEVLHDKIAALQLSVGRGRILLYGFKPQHRGQAHGTYRYLFNALYQYDDPPMPSDQATASTSVVTTSASSAPANSSAPASGTARRRTGSTP